MTRRQPGVRRHQAEEATRAARLRAGTVMEAMEALCGRCRLRWLFDLAQDLRHAFRLMRRAPAFTAMTCLTLAIGIGANTAVFSLLDVLLWRDLPVRDAGSLAQLTWQYPGDPPLHAFRTQDFEHFRDHNDVFSDLVGTAPVAVDAAGGGELLNTEWVTGNYFTALGVGAAAGRLLQPSDSGAGAAPVAVVSWDYWQRRFARDPGAVGTTLSVAGVPATVIGIAARQFAGVLTGYRTDVWIPASAAPPKSRQSAGFLVMGRLQQGVSRDRATAQMRALDRPRIEELGRRDPQWLKTTLHVEPARSGFSTPLHQQFGRPLLAVMIIVGVLLLLTCANIASMLLARATTRQREMAVRTSLGASRSRLMRQMLAESLLLSLVGTALAIVVAQVGASALVRIMASGTRIIGAQPQLDVAIDGTALMFTMAAAIVAAALFGLAPALTASAPRPMSTLRAAAGPIQSRGGRLAGSGLVVAQVAVSLVLVTVAAQFIEHLFTLRNRALGFDRRSVLLVGLDTSHLPAAPQRQSLRELLERFATIPGVRSVTLSGMTPMSGAAGSRFVTVDGFDEPASQRRRVSLNIVAPGYFDTFGTALLSGRDFRAAEAAGTRVAVVNQAMARHYFAGVDPVGRQLVLEGDERAYNVVGVVADAKYSDLRIPAPPIVYLDAFQQDRLPSQFALRTQVSPASVLPDVRRIVAAAPGGMSVRTVTTLTDQLDASIVPERLSATLSGFFGATGALLAAIGLFGLLAYTVARRTSEIGIRMSLGATQRDVTRMVIGQALSLVGIGLCAGAPIALWGRRLAAATLDGMTATTVLPLAAATVTMLTVALLASCVPVRRAVRVEPIVALRSE